MNENELRDVVSKKAYEITYAACRIAAGSPIFFSDALSRRGMDLFEAATEYDIVKTRSFLSALNYMMKLGAGIGAIHQKNADAVVRQIAGFTDFLSSDAFAKKHVNEVDLSDIFSDGFGNIFMMENKEKAEISEKNIRLQDIYETGSVAEYPAIDGVLQEGDALQEKTSEDSEPVPVSISSDLRQSEILNYVRQSGNCRIKDLQEMFPRCSERTLRYDLESLIGRKLIRRIGAGSATAYEPAADMPIGSEYPRQ